jgi:O-acetylhomoserine (thiol)-lyase
MNEKNYRLDTQCIHSGYKAENGEPQVMPIVQSTTFRYNEPEDVAALFNLESAGYFYSRLGNPTVGGLEAKMAALEGGVAAVATSSGTSAVLMTMVNLCVAGDHFISSKSIYGGSYNLFAVTLKKMGIECTFVDQDDPAEVILQAARPNTKAFFAESLGNPTLTVLDFNKISAIAKKIGVPLIIDNTLATPAFCKPLELGADIVIHSTTKYADGHATSLGGMIIDGGKFDWTTGGKFPGLTEPEPSYHGLQYTKAFGAAAFAVKLRTQGLRDLGCTMAPFNAFLTMQGLQTLPLRMERHSKNALALAEFLQNHPKVDWVVYPGLKGDKYYELAQKYLPKGQSGVLSFGIKGGAQAGENFLRSIELISLVVHVGDIRTCALHPASSTHRQLSAEEQLAANIRPEAIRLSAGLEDIRDLIEDLDAALNKA